MFLLLKLALFVDILSFKTDSEMIGDSRRTDGSKWTNDESDSEMIGDTIDAEFSATKKINDREEMFAHDSSSSFCFSHFSFMF